MDVLMYLRKSRAEELHDTTEETLRRHKEQLMDLSVQRGYHIIATYEEVVSGESLYARPQMLALLSAVETGNFDAVLVMDIDRLGRGSMAEQGLIFDTFRRSKTRIITPEKVYDLSNDSDEEITELQSFIARRELKIIKKRLHRGVMKTFNDGYYIANAPYGYRKTKKDKRPTLEIYEPEAKFVRMIFDMYVNSGIGTQTIAEQINSLGAKPQRSEKFNRSTVAYIIKNPVYIGKVTWDKTKYTKENGTRKAAVNRENMKVVDGVHPAIIEEETFSRAQEIMKKQWHKKYFDGTVKNPLAGLVICGNCGRKMMRHPAGGKSKEPFVLCRTKSCIPSVSAAELEAAVLEDIKKQLRALDADIDQSVPPDVSAFDKSIQTAENEIKQLSHQTAKTYDLLEQGIYDVDTFIERRDALDKRTAFLKKYIASEQERRQSVIDSDRRIASAKIHNVLDVYDSSDATQRNALLRSIVDSITYFRPSTPYRAPFSITVKLKIY